MSGQAIYVMQVPSGYVKIGIAKDAPLRLSVLQTGNPEPIRLVAWFDLPGFNSYEIEREMHSWLRLFHVRGEWFRVPLDLVFRAQKVACYKIGAPKVFARWQRMRAKKRAERRVP